VTGNRGFKYRYLWTWDHSTNWDLNQPGQQEEGCNNSYLKPPEAFLCDYRKLIDYASGLDLNGVIIWGFLRDDHGGREYAAELCDYARELDVRIIAGVGVMAYGGIYYQGNNPYSMEKWLSDHPEMSALDPRGRSYNWQASPDRPRMQALCPSREENLEWCMEGVRWLVESLDIGGINFESGDYGVCHCRKCKAKKRTGIDILSPGTQTGDINVSFDLMAEVYPPLMEMVHDIDPGLVQTYSPYCGYRPDMSRYIRPLLDAVPEYAVCQWTLTHMLSGKHGFGWDDDLSFPSRHGIGYLHQGTQWFDGPGEGRHDLIVDTIQRAARLGYESGLEGLVLHGEVAGSEPNWSRNYQTFSSCCRNPMGVG